MLYENRFNSALYGLNEKLKNKFLNLDEQLKEEAEEIRIRADKPCFITYNGKNYKCDFSVTKKEMQDIFSALCNHSVYSHSDEIKMGYINTHFGHRVGICGTAVTENGEIKGFTKITSVNIRIAKEVVGAAEDFFKNYKGEGALIFGPPASGKTTVLRDIARSIEKRVVIVDTRGEIAFGNIGDNTDVYFGVSKAKGIRMAVKTLFPEIIIFDEIGTKEEIKAVADGINCGVSVITTAHAGNLEQLYKREVFRPLFKSGAIKQIFMCKDKKVFKVKDL